MSAGRLGAGLVVGLVVAGFLGAAPAGAADPQCPQQKPGKPLDAAAPQEPTIARLGLDRAWKLSQGQGVTVAVVDSGVDGSIVKLRPALVQGFDFRQTQTAAGFSKSVGGSTGDCDAHGTPIASMIAARPGTDNRVVGVAPAARIAPVRFANIAIGQISDTMLAQMIRTAADLGQVINLSWATEVDYKSVHQAINYALSKDVVVVAAADNDQSAPDAKFYPAAYPGVLAVNAVKADGTPLQPNNHESWIGLAAPGEQITALAPVGGYGVWSGTSFATALVSGVVALVRARYPTLRGPQVVQRLVSTAVPLGAPKDQVGAGMVDPFAALTAQGLSGSGASATPTGSPVAGGSVAVAPRPAAAESIAHRWGTMLAWGGVLGLAAILAYLARIATRSALRRRWRAGGGPLPEESPYAQPMDPPNVRLL